MLDFTLFVLVAQDHLVLNLKSRDNYLNLYIFNAMYVR
jgi:hypothetical protein